MFKFEMDEEVMIDIDHVPNTNIHIAPGTMGRVVSMREHSSWVLDRLFYAVSYSGRHIHWFAESHLLPKDGHNKMPEPLFDLDDMELAEILMEELREK